MQLFAILSTVSRLAAQQGLTLKRVATIPNPRSHSIPRYQLVNLSGESTGEALTLAEILARFAALPSQPIAQAARQLLDELNSSEYLEAIERYMGEAVRIHPRRMVSTRSMVR